jgi:hypothetical protein
VGVRQTGGRTTMAPELVCVPQPQSIEAAHILRVPARREPRQHRAQEALRGRVLPLVERGGIEAHQRVAEDAVTVPEHTDPGTGLGAQVPVEREPLVRPEPGVVERERMTERDRGAEQPADRRFVRGPSAFDPHHAARTSGAASTP